MTSIYMSRLIVIAILIGAAACEQVAGQTSAHFRAIESHDRRIMSSLADAPYRAVIDGSLWWVGRDGVLWKMDDPTNPLSALEFGPLSVVDWDSEYAPDRDAFRAAILATPAGSPRR